MNQPVSSEVPLGDRDRRRSLFAVVAGGAVEYFDWIIYAGFAVYFAGQLFRPEDQTSAFLQSAAIFAVGFLFRPLGALLLGKLADQRGRKDALLVSVGLMTVGTTLIAVIPTYDQIGAWASLLLLIGRILQGAAYGGEFGSVASSLREIAPPERRGLYSSAYQLANVFGQIAAFGLLLVLQAILSAEQMSAFGWRIAFAFAAVGGIVVAIMRRSMVEGPEFVLERARHETRGSLREMFAISPASFWLGSAITIACTVPYYTYAVYSQKLAVNSFGLDIAQASTIPMVALVLQGFLLTAIGSWGDRIGTAKILAIGSLLCALTAVPGYLIMLAFPSFPVVLLTICLLIIGPSILLAVAPVATTGLFPARVRGVGSSFCQAANVAIFGGTAEYVALSFKRADVELLFFVYVAATGVLGFIAAVLMSRRTWPGDRPIMTATTTSAPLSSPGAGV